VRTIIGTDDDLYRQATELTGVEDVATLVRLGLEALVARERALRLAKLGGTEQQSGDVPTRRSCTLMRQFSSVPRRITFGVLEDRIDVAPDFDAPLPEDVLASFEGREGEPKHEASGPTMAK